jgi:hypothetical protein
MAQVPDWRAPSPQTNEFSALEDLRQVVVAAGTFCREYGKRVGPGESVSSITTDGKLSGEELLCISCGHSKIYHPMPFDFCQFEIAPNRVCGCTRWAFEQ